MANGAAAVQGCFFCMGLDGMSLVVCCRGYTPSTGGGQWPGQCGYSNAMCGFKVHAVRINSWGGCVRAHPLHACGVAAARPLGRWLTGRNVWPASRPAQMLRGGVDQNAYYAY